MENSFIDYLETVCKKRISNLGANSYLSLETFFCDNSIDIKQFAELTDWWFNQQKLNYLISANDLLNHISILNMESSNIPNQLSIH
jgi:hypothetical protein